MWGSDQRTCTRRAALTVQPMDHLIYRLTACAFGQPWLPFELRDPWCPTANAARARARLVPWSGCDGWLSIIEPLAHPAG
jgi:hypothetical protein